MNRTRQIVIERHRSTIMKTSGKHHSAHCESCGETLAAFAPEQIAVILKSDLTEVVAALKLTRFT